MSLLVPNVVGIRHLSPAGATHLRTVLERVRPTCVLVEARSGSSRRCSHPRRRGRWRAGHGNVVGARIRAFEHTTDSASYIRAAFALGEGMGELRQDEPAEVVRDELRESFMHRQIREAIARGHAPDKCVVVRGAYHAPVLTEGAHAMSDQEKAALPVLEMVTTLMPYSHQRLHARSGYGAGNHAPLYYQMLIEELAAGHPEHLAARYLAQAARRARSTGLPRSPSQIIDAVRLAGALAAASNSPAIALCDLRDAAVTCLAGGERAPLAEVLDDVQTGHAIGTLPRGISRMALQDDLVESLDRSTRWRLILGKTAQPSLAALGQS